jgi:hypothetical protein
MKLKNIFKGPIFLTLYILVTPLQWVMTFVFIKVLKLHTWVCTHLNDSLNLPNNEEQV